MCGIAGYLTFNPSLGNRELVSISAKMTNALEHRGPDDEGIWTDEATGVALGHRRLSIIDLSPSGHQPMLSSDMRYVIVLNGEIYNYLDLRKQLIAGGLTFQGSSDTEVAVNAIQYWGLEGALPRLTGMFALGVWDREQRILSLARDRLGEKPLYFGWLNSGFVFASELKAIVSHPDWRAEVNRDALAMLLKYSYVPAPYCIYQGINKLQPGMILQLSFPIKPEGMRIQTYWSLEQVVSSAISGGRALEDKVQVVDQLETLLKSTIKDKMISDVPLGAFLSGGIDSSAVVALMQSQSSTPIKTFSIGFHERDYNEAEHAKEVASYLATDHTELYISSDEARAVIPSLPLIYDEPFADSSQIPTCLISALAKKSVTVALSGDGGDELFGGYTRYLVGTQLWNKVRACPAPVRKLASTLIMTLPPHLIDQLYHPLHTLLPDRYRYRQMGSKMHKLAAILHDGHPDLIYSSLTTLWENPEQVVIGAKHYAITDQKKSMWDQIEHFSEKMMYADTVSYLPDDILTKVDRASMAVSLEVRVPFLDHRIVEFIWNQSPDLKLANGQGKYLLREVLYRHVPKTMLDRPKMGFGVPIEQWLRGPLRTWAENLLSYDRLKREGYFNPDPIRQKWEEHLSMKNSWHYQLWPVLMFQAWHENWMAH